MECSICYNTHEPKLFDICSVRCCKQQFHWNCLSEWLNRSQTRSCPMCRKIIKLSQYTPSTYEYMYRYTLCITSGMSGIAYSS